jgi:hypothetical protein
MNGMKVLKYSAAVITAVALFGISSAQAMSVNWAANAGTALTTANPSVGLPSGDLIELGYTTSSASAIQAAFSSGGASAVQGLFTIWTTDYVTDGTDPTAAGTYTVSTVAGNGTDSALFSKQIYLLAFNATTVAGATEAGVFAGAPFNGQSNTGDNWTFPAADNAGAPSIEASDVVAAGVLLGSYGVGTDPGTEAWFGNSPPQYNALELAENVVPEPSSIALVVLGMIGAIGMIRRNRR